MKKKEHGPAIFLPQSYRGNATAKAITAILLSLFFFALVPEAEANDNSPRDSGRRYYDKVGESPLLRETGKGNITERAGWKNFRMAVGNDAARGTSVVIIFFLVAAALAMDLYAQSKERDASFSVSSADNPFQISPFRSAPVNPSYILLLAIPLLLLASKYFLLPWNILFIPSEDIFYPAFDLPADVRKILTYLVERPARPMVPFRLMLVFLFMFHRSVSVLRALSFLFAAATIILAFIMARRHTRGWLPALAAASALSMCPGFDYGLIDIRGYMFAAFFTLLSVFLYTEFLRKQTPVSAFFQFLAHIIAITSYPSSAAVFAGVFFHYVFFARGGLPSRSRRSAETHFLLVFLCIVVFTPLLLGNIGHKLDRMYDGGGIHPGFAPYDIYAAVCAIVFIASFAHFKKNTGGAILASAIAGSATLLALMSFMFVFRADRYLLFVLPLNMVCVAISAEFIVMRAHERGPAVFAAALGFSVLMLAAPAVLGLRSSLSLKNYLDGTSRAAEEISAHVDDAAGLKYPVLIYPQEFFYVYIAAEYGLNDLRTSGSTISKIRDMRLPDNGDMREFGEIRTSWPPVPDPASHFGKPVRIVIAYRSVLMARATMSRMGGLQDNYTKDMRGTFTHLYESCVTESETDSYTVKTCFPNEK